MDRLWQVFEKKEPGECKRLQRKGLELEARESECIEWQNMEGTAALAARKEETSVEQEKKYFYFDYFLFGRNWQSSVGQKPEEGGSDLPESNSVRSGMGEWFIQLEGQSWVPGAVTYRHRWSSGSLCVLLSTACFVKCMVPVIAINKTVLSPELTCGFSISSCIINQKNPH